MCVCVYTCAFVCVRACMYECDIVYISRVLIYLLLRCSNIRMCAILCAVKLCVHEEEKKQTRFTMI